MPVSVASPLLPAHAAGVTPPRDRLLRLPEVEALVGIRKSSIYVLMKQGKFPPCVHVTSRLSAWPESAVYQWVQDRIHKGGV
ncbi:helix-turn-helix transcriptional regulator [Aquabacterium sp.]|uniref:helix-turn-helix transcriptional regulator n=1 Tax=Aquabacterium sp. TaxID=1872578 RepID=UPI0035B3196F